MPLIRASTVLTHVNFIKLIELDQSFREYTIVFRGGSRTVATSKMEDFVIIVNS